MSATVSKLALLRGARAAEDYYAIKKALGLAPIEAEAAAAAAAHAEPASELTADHVTMDGSEATGWYQDPDTAVPAPVEPRYKQLLCLQTSWTFPKDLEQWKSPYSLCPQPLKFRADAVNEFAQRHPDHKRQRIPGHAEDPAASVKLTLPDISSATYGDVTRVLLDWAIDQWLLRKCWTKIKLNTQLHCLSMAPAQPMDEKFVEFERNMAKSDNETESRAYRVFLIEVAFAVFTKKMFPNRPPLDIDSEPATILATILEESFQGTMQL